MTASPRRILHLIDTTGPGGAETIFIELCSHFRSDSWESWPVVAGPGWVHDTLVARGLRPYVLPPSGRGFDTRYLARLWSLVHRHHINVVQTHLLGPAVYGAIAGTLSRVPVVSTFHGMWDLATEGRLKAIKRRVLRWRLSRAVFVSAALRRAFEEGGFSFLPGRALVIHNGVDVGRRGPPARDAARARLGIAPDELVIGAVGNLRRAKSYDVLLAVAAEVRRGVTDLRTRFVVAGDVRGPQGESLLRQRDALGLADYVTFLGFREDVWDVLGALDVYVSTSQSEGFSLTAVQALATGVPVVATRSGGPEEIVTDGQTGFLVEVGAVGAIAGALMRLVRDPALRASLGRAGPPSVTTRFTLRRMLDAYEKVYLEAMLPEPLLPD